MIFLAMHSVQKGGEIMTDKKKEQELEERRKQRESKKLNDDLGTNVSGGSIANVNYTSTGEITKKIKNKI